MKTKRKDAMERQPHEGIIMLSQEGEIGVRIAFKPALTLGNGEACRGKGGGCLERKIDERRAST